MSNRVSVVLLLLGLLWVDAADAQRAPGDSPAWFLSVREGKLTADIRGISLRFVLEELARQVPLRLTLSDESRDHPVTAHFRALALDEALARLLAGFSYAIIHEAPAPDGVESAAAQRVVEVLVIGKARGATTAVGSNASAVASDTRARAQAQTATHETTPEWTAVLQHPDQAVRLEALQRWAEQGAATPLNPLTHALVDPDESVRARAQALVERVWAAKADAEAR